LVTTTQGVESALPSVSKKVRLKQRALINYTKPEDSGLQYKSGKIPSLRVIRYC